MNRMTNKKLLWHLKNDNKRKLYPFLRDNYTNHFLCPYLYAKQLGSEPEYVCEIFTYDNGSYVAVEFKGGASIPNYKVIGYGLGVK